MFDRIFGQPSARVVAIARFGLASVFLIATVADPVVGDSPAIIPVLGGFVCFAAIVAVMTWNNWWIDARTAAATHVIDTGFFIAVVILPEGYSSPYFLFFIFLLLSTAIRRTWKDTALTAVAVLALYLIAGLLFARTAHPPFEARRFVIRTGYLFILSLVLMWFGFRRRFSAGSVLAEPTPSEEISEEQPLAKALRAAARATKAGQALALWASPDGKTEAITVTGDELGRLALSFAPRLSELRRSFLFDARRNRALVCADSREPLFESATALIGDDLAGQLAFAQGIGIPVQNRLGEGVFLLWGIEDLHSDHLTLGESLASEIAHLIEHFALLSALRDGAVTRERLSLARDLHDGIVQFLAGSAYKVEAISASTAKGSDVSADLQELKRLMILEQEELRASIGTLRKEKVSLAHTASEAAALCDRQSRHWRVKCSFNSKVSELLIPMRIHADIMHIIKEGVANAVRHARAENLDVDLKTNGERIELCIVNDAPGGNGAAAQVPWSIRERVAEVAGSASVHMSDGMTSLLVAVPIPEEAH
jgi:signal transduction histidine kinase